MPERPRPEIDRTREALRQHDERTEDEPEYDTSEEKEEEEQEDED